ncbi:hypothetical protein GCM10027516_39250 [Niabella aquatica]
MWVCAQKETYDIVSYTPPAGWKKENNSTAVVYSRIDGGSWAQFGIYQSTASKGSIEEDAEHEWNAIVLALHVVEKEEKTTAETAEGWSVMSRSGVWQYNGANVATILTTYSNGKTCVSILCNATAQPYLKDFQKLIASITLAYALKNTTTANVAIGISTIKGLWANNQNETFGYMSGGYFRREYLFNADGTYQYRAKHWSNVIKDIQFIRETGTYTINGNQLTLVPRQATGEWWSKAKSGRTNEWGSYQKAYQHPLEKTTYTFEIKNLSGMENTYLILKTNKPTARDSKQSNQGNANEFNYSSTPIGKSLIDNPPGK